MQDIQSLSDLCDLQDVDLDIDRLLHTRSSLPELEAYRHAHDLAEEAAGNLAKLEDELRSASLELDKNEGELALLEDKLQREERRLFAGGMSARETEHMRHEVENLRTQRGGMEETVLEGLDQRESLEASTATAREALESARAEEGSLEAQVAGEWKGIDAQIGRREQRKSEIIPLIPEDLLDLYERLRVSKEGVAVGRLVDGICGGCHLALSAREQNEALAEDPPRCIHCRRILVP